MLSLVKVQFPLKFLNNYVTSSDTHIYLNKLYMYAPHKINDKIVIGNFLFFKTLFLNSHLYFYPLRLIFICLFCCICYL